MGMCGRFLQCTPQLALDAAARVDAARAAGRPLPPLAGVPFAIKDNMNLMGTLATTCASRMLETFESPFTATCVQRMLDAGCVPIGKVNMDEFAFGSTTESSAFHPTHNPWDFFGRVPGGSSGGSAAAVAAGMVLLALGSGTGGSIRQRAALCGVVGMKPSYGMVSRYGVVAFGSSLDQVGTARPQRGRCRLGARRAHGARLRDPYDMQRAGSGPRCRRPCYARCWCWGWRVGVIPAFMDAPGLDDDMKEGHAACRARAANKIREPSWLRSSCRTSRGHRRLLRDRPGRGLEILARFDGVRYGHQEPGCSKSFRADRLSLARPRLLCQDQAPPDARRLPAFLRGI